VLLHLKVNFIRAAISTA